MSLRQDPLFGLSETARRQRERDDAAYVAAAPITHVGTAEAIAVRDMVFAGNPELTPAKMQPHVAGEALDAIICARVDLDHPIYFTDNLFADCTDCGCRLQYRPHAPPGPRLCICCAADRLRTEAGNRDA